MDDRSKQIRRIRWRSVHRGTKEVDLLLGGFVDRYVEKLDKPSLNALEAFLSYPDPQMHSWLIQETPPPETLPEDLKTLIGEYRYSPPPR